VHHFRCHAAKPDLAQSSSPVGCHDDQIGVFGLCDIDDLIRRNTFNHTGPHVEAVGAQTLRHTLQILARFGNVVACDDADQQQGCADPRGNWLSGSQRLFGERRTVKGNADGAVGNFGDCWMLHSI